MERSVKWELVSSNKNIKKVTLSKGESLEKVHAQMQDLFIENLNKTTVLISNGLENP
ncbi:hypothetical protein CCAN11_2440048 [Capnocytophaga canimorsus]|uniref:Uncharacterized protein n=1 Tax=Capnocytophaga canimorsus TaxID=28188 RepID=A0A0B7IP37_9FLAO|nr:hypothetical protein CCAN11_2440048 [Capnocytophaga canimorsus]